MEKNKFCPALWLSGFFGLGALVHLARLIMGVSVVIAGHEIPLSLSVVVVVVFGMLSAGLLIVSLKKPCETGKSRDGSSCCNK